MDNIRSRFLNITILIIYLILILEVNLRLYSLSSNVADLGFFIHNISNALSNPSIIVTGHVQPLILPLSLLINIVPVSFKGYLLINLQAFIVILTGYLLYKQINNYIGFIYSVNLPIWIMTLFDFHLDVLILPLIFFCYLFYDKGNYFRVSIATVLICMIKEPYALVSSFFGLYILIDQVNKKNIRAFYLGIFVFLFGIFWFFIAVIYIMPKFNSGNYGALSSNAYSWILNINTLININALFDYNYINKLLFLILPFSILGFIPIFQPKYLIPAMPIFLIGILSLNKNYFDYNNHYLAATSIPLLIALNNFISNSLYKNGIKIYVVVCSLCGLIYLGSTPISRLFWNDKISEYSWRAYIPSERKLEISKLLIKHIPRDTAIAVSTQNNISTSELSSRNYYYLFPQGVKFDDSLSSNTKIADYVILDTKIPLFINADGCSWYFGKCHDEVIVNKYFDYISRLTNYELILNFDGFMIYKIK